MKWRGLSTLCEKVNALRKYRRRYLDEAKSQKRQDMMKELDDLAEEGFKAKQVITDVKGELIRYFETDVKDLQELIAQRRRDVEAATHDCNKATKAKEVVDGRVQNAKVKVDAFMKCA